MVCRALGSKRDFSPALLETRAHGRLHAENWSGAIAGHDSSHLHGGSCLQLARRAHVGLHLGQPHVELTAFKGLATLCQASSSAMLPQPWPFYAIWLHEKYFEGNVNPQ